MIFEVTPELLHDLDALELAKLLRQLLHAEAQKFGISLSSVAAPLQIFVADGGEDARVAWTGGASSTDHLPCRFCIFQSKSGPVQPAEWKKETWTKASQKKGAQRKLNDAFTKAIANGGSYIGFTSAALVGNQPDDRIKAIREGIHEAGGDPDKLVSIDIYDANKIAKWCERHPSVAVWLHERASGLALRGFQTIENWGKQKEFSAIEFIEDKAARYSLEGRDIIAREGQRDPERNALVFQQAKDRITNHLEQTGRCVRIKGPSGIGKSRFVHELLKDTSTLAKSVNAASAICCDYRIIGEHQLLQTAQHISDTGGHTLIVVDECPRDIAGRLGEIAAADGCALRVLTIDIDERQIDSPQWLNISVNATDDELIEGIIRQRLPNADRSAVDYIKGLCGGFPRIAVLATEKQASQMPVLHSIDDVVERVLRGCGISDQEHRRALECLALFDKLGADEEFAEQFELVARVLAGMSGDRMYEYLSLTAKTHIVDRRGRFFKLQPLPIVAFLGSRRIDLMRISTLMNFIEDASPSLLAQFFQRWRYFDQTRIAPAVAHRLLAIDGLYGSFDALDSEAGSDVIDALVHVAPDAVMQMLHRVLRDKSQEDLEKFIAGRRHTVWALEKLAFRSESFSQAARHLMRLAAAENEEWGNNAAGQFKQLYHIQLSGTEAPPSDRFAVLDEGLASEDEAIVNVCLEALENTLDTSSFSRSGGAESIGSGQPLRDWHPGTWGEVYSFHREGLNRLVALRSRGDPIAARCEGAIANHLRGIICEGLIGDIEGVVARITSERGLWLEAIRSIGDWLYFDRGGFSDQLSERVRALYDSLMPKDLLQQALLYTKFWSAQIRNPDTIYDKSDAKHDFNYATRKACELATQIAADPNLTQRTIAEMVGQELHNAFPFAHQLGQDVQDPSDVFSAAIQAYDRAGNEKGMQFIRGLLSGIDQKDAITGHACLQNALKSEALKARAVDLYTAIKITPEHLGEVVQRLRDGTMPASNCVTLSYGRGLDHLTVAELLPLMDELSSAHGAQGVWALLEIVSMYQLGRGTLDGNLEAKTKELLVSPRLLEEMPRGNRDSFVFESLIETIHLQGTLDARFAEGLAGQITRVCQSSDTDLFYLLDEPFRKVIRLLVNERPNDIWQALSRFFEVATARERHQLESLIGPSTHGDNHHSEGILFGVPEEAMISWAKVDAANRAPFLCMFYPVLADESTEPRTWHDALRGLAMEFGGVRTFRQTLASRLRPSSWWGSIVPFLEISLAPLNEWFNHPIPALAQWARDVHGSLLREIDRERKRREEEN